MGSPANPLGPKWTLSPSPRSNNTLISYSIEPACRKTLSRQGGKSKIPQAYLLAKSGTYLNPPGFPWTLPSLSHLRSSLGIRLVSGMHTDDPNQAEMLRASGIENFGQLQKAAFHAEIAKSSVLIGAGLPKTSPSPWEALCLGTPVSISAVCVRSLISVHQSNPGMGRGTSAREV